VAAYARPGDAFTFYEIDRLVRDISWTDHIHHTLTERNVHNLAR